MIAQIEDAIINAIKNAAGLGYTPRTVASYGGEFDDDLAVVVRAFPAVWVSYAGSGKPIRKGEHKWIVPVTFSVLVGARNVRGERAARRGAVTGEVGTYQMLADVQALLLGQDFGLAIEPLSPGAVRNLRNSKIAGQALSVYASEWHTDYVLTKLDPVEGELLRLGARYHLAPDDGNADATDVLELRV